MAIEDHPKFSVWKVALEKLLEAKEALRAGTATQADVDKALEDYVKVADDL